VARAAPDAEGAGIWQREDAMRRALSIVSIAVLMGLTLAAQSQLREIQFDSVANPLTLPDGVYLGEVAGVAANSKGDIFVYTRTGHPTISIGSSRAFAHGGSRLFQFDRAGKFVREIGKDSYGFLFAQQVRIDPQDNIWVVDQMSNMVIKFDPAGRVALLLGRKPESVPVPAGGRASTALGAGGEGGGGRGRGGLAGAGSQADVFNRPADVAWDAAGNIFVADGFGNARIAEFDKHGVFVRSWGSKGTEPGSFSSVAAIAVDAHGNIYAADPGNRRIQVFDNSGAFKTQFTNVGAPSALCLTLGPTQFLYSSNSNPPEDFDTDGEIYKLRLDGGVVGRFGKAGKRLKEFGAVNSLDCRSENIILVGETANMRVQKLTLQ
jgi:DNA-binding beta-propeller fold protein YncE